MRAAAMPPCRSLPADRLAVARRPTPAQRRYLERGLTQAGGKLPLFDRDGREVVEADNRILHRPAAGPCPGVHNPIKPGWLVCRLFRGRLSGAGR